MELCGLVDGLRAVNGGPLANARYVEQTTGQPQKLLYADWIGMPTAQEAAALQRSGDPMWRG